jgi:hypothetical protein
VPASSRQEQGQIAPALLLFVVAVLFVALVFAQVGSAAEQKTQARSVADSAAVASTQNLRDNRISVMSRTVPYWWAAAIFATAAPAPLRVQQEACTAAQRNWSANPHGTGFSCGAHLLVLPVGDGARTRVTAPAGEVVDGPVDASARAAEAAVHARVVLARCPRVGGVQGALARWITDAAVRSFGSASLCFTAGDASLLASFGSSWWGLATYRAAVGPPEPILTMARDATRIEIIE